MKDTVTFFTGIFLGFSVSVLWKVLGITLVLKQFLQLIS